MSNRNWVLALVLILSLVVRSRWLFKATFRPRYSRDRPPLPTVHEAACASGHFWIGKTNEIINKSESMWEYIIFAHVLCQLQWPCSLSYTSAAVHLLELLVWIPPGARISVCCVCCVLSGIGLCFGLVTHSEESYRVWGVWVWLWSLDNYPP